MKTNYKLNYYHFHKMVDRLFSGVALTTEHLNKAYTEIWDYLRDSEDWREYPELLKLRKKTYKRGDKLLEVAIFYVTDTEEIKLEYWQVENIVYILSSKLV